MCLRGSAISLWHSPTGCGAQYCLAGCWGGRHWGEPSIQSNCGLKRLHDCKLRTLRARPILYPLLSEVTLEFSLLTLEEASDPHLRF